MRLQGGSSVLMPERTVLGSPVIGRWGVGLMRRLAAPKRVVCRDTETDERVVQDAQQIHRMLEALSRHRAVVTLQSSDGRQFGRAMLRTQADRHVLLDWTADELVRAGDLPPNLNVIASGERGLLFFTLHGLAPRSGALMHTREPDTLIQVQSRRHFRVHVRTDGLLIKLPGVPGQLLVRDISEEGVGLAMEGRDWPAEGTPQQAVLHLPGLTLPVPALLRVHSGEGTAASNRVMGARLGGMSADHVRQLRRWLAARQAASLAAQPDQV